MTLAEEMLLRIEIAGGNKKVIKDISREWGFGHYVQTKRWTEEENAYLKKWFSIYSYTNIAKRLKRSRTAVYVQSLKLGLVTKKAA